MSGRSTDGFLDYRPPDPTTHLRLGNLSRKEAKAYCEWFLDRIEERIAELGKAAAAVDPPCQLDRSPESLWCLGALFVTRVSSRPKSKEERQAEIDSVPQPLRSVWIPEDQTLDEASLGLALDVGTYFAETLRASFSSLTWKLWDRKTVDRRRPVLVGFVGDVPLDPFRIANTIASAHMHDGDQSSRLRELYEYWAAQVVDTS